MLQDRTREANINVLMEINTIYCENCLETMSRMSDGFIDLTVTSPPYDNLRNYNGYIFDFESIAKELYRVTKLGGVVVWVVGDATVNGSETGTSFKQALYFKEIGFNLHDTMIWQTPGFSNPSSNRYHQVHQYMFVFSKDVVNRFNPIKDRKVINQSFGVISTRGRDGELVKSKKITNTEITDGMRFNIWTINSTSNENPCKKILHPATFPEQLAADHIYSWSNENDLVYDPFMGSGTTAKMAHIMKRNWIGSEISQKYVDLANKRLIPYLTQTVMF